MCVFVCLFEIVSLIIIQMSDIRCIWGRGKRKPKTNNPTLTKKQTNNRNKQTDKQTNKQWHGRTTLGGECVWGGGGYRLQKFGRTVVLEL